MTSLQRIMITGSTGYVGGRLAEVLAQKGAELVLPIRADNSEVFQLRKSALQEKLGAKIQVVQCDISNGSDVQKLPVDVSQIVHCSAVTRFNVEEATANLNNVEGSRQVFSHARSCKALRRIDHISTVYVAGSEEGPVPETLLPKPAAFANHYERSKWETENMLAREFDDLPWNIFRVATVIADDESGKFTQQNAVHNTLKLLYHGLISLVPGRLEVPLYLVCGNFVVNALVAAFDQSQRHSVFHVCHRQSESITLGKFIDVAFESFMLDQGFADRGIKKPLYVDEQTMSVFTDGVAGFGGAVLNQALSSIGPFAKQLFLMKDFENDNLRGYYQSYSAPDPVELTRRLISMLIATRWGKV